jgi:8-oxo-dGTP pyrophosphatase MutT (NUDIX family)
MYPRPGFGVRNEELLEVLRALQTAASDRVHVHPGVSLEVAAYTTPVVLTEELVSSFRCQDSVGSRFVLCHTPNGRHLVPGGRRKAGESHAETACREVHEETGWLVDPADLRELGFFHYRFLDSPVDRNLPHPDFLQIIFTAEARSRDRSQGTDWADVLGWEQRSELKTAAELDAIEIGAHERAFLALLR